MNLTKDKNARKFLYLMLSIVVIFVTVVCLVINNRNNQIISGATIGETDKVQEEQQVTEKHTEKETENVTDKKEDKKPETTITPQTTKQQVTAVASGTIDNPTLITIDENNWHLTLVNSGYRIPEDYKPDLVYVCGSSERLDKKVAEHYEAMFDAASKDGVYLTPCSGYRDYELQKRNYNNKPHGKHLRNK